MIQICPSSKTLSVKELKMLRQWTPQNHVYHTALSCIMTLQSDWHLEPMKKEPICSCKRLVTSYQITCCHNYRTELSCKSKVVQQAYRGVKVQLILNQELNGDKVSASHPSHFSPRKTAASTCWIEATSDPCLGALEKYILTLSAIEPQSPYWPDAIETLHCPVFFTTNETYCVNQLSC